MPFTAHEGGEGVHAAPSWVGLGGALLLNALLFGGMWGSEAMLVTWTRSDLAGSIEDKGRIWAKLDVLQSLAAATAAIATQTKEEQDRRGGRLDALENSFHAAQAAIASIAEIKTTIHEQEVARQARAEQSNEALNNLASSVGVLTERLNNLITSFDAERRSRYPDSSK